MPLSEEDLIQVVEHLTPTLKGITDSTSKLVNDGITKRFERFEKSFGDNVKSALGEIAADIDTRLEQKVAALKPADLPPPDGKAKGAGEAGKPAADPIHDAAMKALEKKIADQDKAMAKLNEERAAEKRKARDITRRHVSAEAYTKAGGDPARVNHALGYLQSEGRIGYESDDSDALVFRDESGEAVDLATGIAGWLKSPDGQHYMPPRGSNGSGGTSGKAPTRKAGAPTAGDLAELLGSMSLTGAGMIGTPLPE